MTAALLAFGCRAILTIGMHDMGASTASAAPCLSVLLTEELGVEGEDQDRRQSEHRRCEISGVQKS